MVGKLTIKRIKALTKPGRYSDGNTLFLRVAESGSKYWIQRLMIHGKRHDLGLGAWPLLDLAEARIKAFENRKQARIDGGDPLAAKRRATVPRFKEAAQKAHEANRGKWKAAHSQNWLASLQKHVFPTLGDTPVDRITGQDLIRLLGPKWHTRTARLVRQRIRDVLGWCLSHGYVTNNEAGTNLDGALPAVAIKKEHFKAVAYENVGSTLQEIESSKAGLAVKLALRFLILTAARSGEILGATWREMDLDRKEWRIPGERMKGGIEHRIPLSAEAVEVLKQARELGDGEGLVFPSPARKGKPLSNAALNKVLKSTGLNDGETLHGFRSSFRTWASENTDADWAVMELSLAHRVGTAVERAYSRSDLLAKRRRLMNQWAAYLSGSRSGKVVNFQA